MKELFPDSNLVLMEGAIVERLRRSVNIELHPTLINAPLIYSPSGRDELCIIYNSYIKLAKKAGVPFLMCTPTWRTNYQRVSESNISKNINSDAVDFLRELRDLHCNFSHKIKIGGLLSCKNDCYKPEEGLSAKDAEEFHAWQIEQLIKNGLDFLIAETLPNINEAIGIAKCLEKTCLPYIISFVISRQGTVLDGTKLVDAISTIDRVVTNKPVGYFVNCAHPSFLCAEEQPVNLFERLIGYLGNASSLDHCQLDDTESLKSDDIDEWGKLMLKLNKVFGIKILGGCCGTDVEHLKYIVDNY